MGEGLGDAIDVDSNIVCVDSIVEDGGNVLPVSAQTCVGNTVNVAISSVETKETTSQIQVVSSLPERLLTKVAIPLHPETNASFVSW